MQDEKYALKPGHLVSKMIGSGAPVELMLLEIAGHIIV
jgi:hypothetical protein